MTDEWTEPSMDECERIARKPSLRYSDWVRLTGLLAGDEIPLFVIDEDQGILPKKWDRDFVRSAPHAMQIEMIEDNEREQTFSWGSSPALLVALVEADISGMLDLPDAFTQAVKADLEARRLTALEPPPPEDPNPCELDDGEQAGDGRIPTLKVGRNSVDAVNAWAKAMVAEHYKDGDKSVPLAERIAQIADRHGYESERGPISRSIVLKNIDGRTGGRGRRSIKTRARKN